MKQTTTLSLMTFTCDVIKTVFIIALVAMLFSCSKPNDLARPQAQEESKIEFSLYGQTKTYVQVNAGAQQSTGVNVYSFVGTKSPVADNIFTLTFMTDSLRPGSYPVNSGVVSFREGNTVVSNVSSNNFVVTITSNVNGLVNGTFSGVLYDHTKQSSCSVIEGRIENIQLFYR